MSGRRNRGRERLPDGRFLPKESIDDSEPKRPNPGAFKPGQSGNPGGQTKGQRAIVLIIGEKTNDGQQLVDKLYDIAFGLDTAFTDQRVRFAALEVLLERFYGKVKQPVDVEGSGQITPEQLALVLALQLSPQERRSRIAELRAKAAIVDVPVDGTPALANGHSDVDGD